jgi:hypothetical protein
MLTLARHSKITTKDEELFRVFDAKEEIEEEEEEHSWDFKAETDLDSAQTAKMMQ